MKNLFNSFKEASIVFLELISSPNFMLFWLQVLLVLYIFLVIFFPKKVAPKYEHCCQIEQRFNRCENTSNSAEFKGGKNE